MTPQTSAHLTDDQFTECVIATPSIVSEAHLKDCAPCREELGRFSTSMSDFSRAALTWSESQPQASLRGAILPVRMPFFAAAKWAVATAFVLGIGIPVVWHQEHAAPIIAVAPPEAPADDSDDQIAEDNQLMKSVNGALRVSEPSPFLQYDLQEAPPSGPRRTRN